MATTITIDASVDDETSSNQSDSITVDEDDESSVDVKSSLNGDIELDDGASDDESISQYPAYTKATWVKCALVASWISIVLTLLAGVGGIVAAIIIKSSAMLGFALESFVDVFSSVLVLWRFWHGGSKDPAVAAKLASREKRASVGIAITFILISIVVGIQAIVHLAKKTEPEEATTLIIIASCCLVAFLVLAVVKFRISFALHSSAMRKDAVTSAAVAILSGGIIVYPKQPFIMFSPFFLSFFRITLLTH